jgi:Tfp pilus assembly PilM family ATPase
MPLTLIPPRKVLSPIGLDVGPTAARVVQLGRWDGAWNLVGAATWSLTRDSSPGKGLSLLQNRVRRALRHQEFAGRVFVGGLSQPDLELHALELPHPGDGPPDGQIESAARWEIERLSGLEGQSVQTAHWWLPVGRGSRTTAIGVAVPETTVRQLWDACTRAGAVCRRIDATACALARAGAVLRPPGPEEVWAVLDIGARAVRLTICIDRIPVLARSLEGGGDAWTHQIAAALQIGTEAAELHKCDCGIRPTGVRGPGGSGTRAVDDREPAWSELAGLIFAALRPDLDRISAEVERSYEYVLQCYPGRAAADLILAGGGAALKKLENYLANRLGISVRCADAYLEDSGSALRIDPTLGRMRQPISTYLGAVGLAISPEDIP